MLFLYQLADFQLPYRFSYLEQDAHFDQAKIDRRIQHSFSDRFHRKLIAITLPEKRKAKIVQEQAEQSTDSKTYNPD